MSQLVVGGLISKKTTKGNSEGSVKELGEEWLWDWDRTKQGPLNTYQYSISMKLAE